MIDDALEVSMSEAYRARNRQNAKDPLLINLKDGRLIPNVPQLGGRKEKRDGTGKVIQTGIVPHPDYRIYRGDPRASKSERMRILATQGAIEGAPVLPGRAQVVDSSVLADVVNSAPLISHPDFDIAKASREHLVAFALEQYNIALDTDPANPTHMSTLRSQVRALAQGQGDLA